MKPADQDRAARRQAIQRMLSGSAVATQEELRRRLAKEGFVASQGTLSRDLARLGARRLARPSGGSQYALEGLLSTARPALELRELITDVCHNGVLVVVHTRPGGASAIARAIDEARLPETLGTLAGDDTIFVAPAVRITARRLQDSLNRLFGRDT